MVARKRLKTSSLLLFNNQRSMEPAKLSLPIFYIKKAEQIFRWKKDLLSLWFDYSFLLNEFGKWDIPNKKGGTVY